MCLKSLYKTEFRGNTGYKILEKDNKGRYLTGIGSAKKVALNKHHYTRNSCNGYLSLEPANRGTYPSGFHIFIDLREAQQALRDLNNIKSRVLCHVRFREQVAYGEVYWRGGAHEPIGVVAKECKVLKEIS